MRAAGPHPGRRQYSLAVRSADGAPGHCSGVLLANCGSTVVVGPSTGKAKAIAGLGSATAHELHHGLQRGMGSNTGGGSGNVSAGSGSAACGGNGAWVSFTSRLGDDGAASPRVGLDRHKPRSAPRHRRRRTRPQHQGHHAIGPPADLPASPLMPRGGRVVTALALISVTFEGAPFMALAGITLEGQGQSGVKVLPGQELLRRTGPGLLELCPPMP